MKLKYLLCIFCFLILRGISYSQDNFENNISIVNRLIEESFLSPGNKLTELGKDKFYGVSFDPRNQSESYLFERFKNRFYDYKLIVNENSDSINYVIKFKDPVINTKYSKIFTDNVIGVKKIVREITVSYKLEITKKINSSSDSLRIILNQNFNKKSKDNIDLDKLTYAEDSRYRFSSSELPEESTLNQIMFPAIIVAASAVAIILFFTIRSK
ncbi:MAG: hypothetical protein ABI528_08935 [bacterium]